MQIVPNEPSDSVDQALRTVIPHLLSRIAQLVSSLGNQALNETMLLKVQVLSDNGADSGEAYTHTW